MENKYHVSYAKFCRIYLLFPIFFHFFLTEDEDFSHYEMIAIATGFFVIIAHVFFKLWIYKAWVITVREDELETFSLLGEKRIQKFSNLTGPMENDFIFIKLHFYAQNDNPKKHTVISDYIKDIKGCLADIEDKMGGETEEK